MNNGVLGKYASVDECHDSCIVRETQTKLVSFFHLYHSGPPAPALKRILHIAYKPPPYDFIVIVVGLAF